MGIFNRFLDWASSEIQKTTGEQDRRINVAKLKELSQSFQEKVTQAIHILNTYIDRFNSNIFSINQIRKDKVEKNIFILQTFLSHFGRCKPIGKYIEESNMIPAVFPTKQLEQIDQYASNYDWSSACVFGQTVCLTPIGMTIKNRSSNTDMQQQLNKFELEMEATLNLLSAKQFKTNLEIQIAELYSNNISFITNFISDNILPELELVTSFFQAESLKNCILCNKSFDNVHFHYAITSLQGTRYDKHYNFIKNAFLFYVISCRIYNTPVLTRLLNGTSSENDVTQLEGEFRLLQAQSSPVLENKIL